MTLSQLQANNLSADIELVKVNIGKTRALLRLIQVR